jgi:hypothetical protein
MTPAQVDLLIAAEHRLSAPADPSQRAHEQDGNVVDLAHLAALAKKAR